jgi:hypothetical protein
MGRIAPFLKTFFGFIIFPLICSMVQCWFVKVLFC